MRRSWFVHTLLREATMGFEPDTEYLDRGKETDQHAAGGAMAWLAFYVIAVAAVIASAFKGAEIVLALAD
jgi:hypothetical protein